jgi:hypothetical protein
MLWELQIGGTRLLPGIRVILGGLFALKHPDIEEKAKSPTGEGGRHVC